MDFLIKNKVSQEILSFNNIKNLSSKNNNYLGLLISITLRFTQIKCLNSLDIKFKRENYSVNASSGEFLEFLLNKIENKDLLMEYALEINQPIVSLLDQVIEDNDEVMQVQLLAVLKVGYFISKS